MRIKSGTHGFEFTACLRRGLDKCCLAPLSSNSANQIAGAVIGSRRAIRAARVWPEADFLTEYVDKSRKQGMHRERRLSFEGAIRISLRALLFLFKDLAFPEYFQRLTMRF